MEKLNEDTIKQIQSSTGSTREVAKQLWVSRESVSKYRNQLWKVLAQEKDKESEKKLKLLEHYSSKEVQEMLSYIAQNTKKEINEVLWEPWHLKFALISDTHLWAKQCAIDELGEFYDKAKDKWVECFVHAWDILDWCDVYGGQQFEQSRVGFSEQIDELKNRYPNVWLPTYFIGWNHDEKFLKQNWVNICKAIETVRQDLINLGFYDARLKLNGIDINLHHWGWSLSYAKDYKMKKYLDGLPVENQPDIFALWHYHTALYDLHRWIHWFMAGAFLKENLLAKRFNLDNTIWGWVIEVDKNGKGQSIINMEFIKF